ncbi:MAG: uroporphyrinogen decarboxylase family protein [Phycisphaerae bacterium]
MTRSMTTRQRMKKVYSHQLSDRVPFRDYPWADTVGRWHREGLPEGVSWVDHFQLDQYASIAVDTSPQMPWRVIEETDDYVIHTTEWGATMKKYKHATSIEEPLEFTCTNPEAWENIKPRIAPTDDRIHWDSLKNNYALWREKGAWISGSGWFSFDVIHSRMIGTETVLMSLVENPEWFTDVLHHILEVNLTLLEKVWDAGYTFDELRWPDDLGYKFSQFMSVQMYRELIRPAHARCVEWAHARGIPAMLHSCGDIRPFIPEFVEIGIDALNPLEVKAGCDPLAIKKQFGDRLVLHGGINAVLWEHPEQIEEHIRQFLPALKADGGYIFASDHSIPNSVSFEDFTRIVELYKELGSYRRWEAMGGEL